MKSWTRTQSNEAKINATMKTRPRCTGSIYPIVFLLLVFLIQRAQAQEGFKCFLLVDGIPGDSTDPRHLQWIEGSTFSDEVIEPPPQQHAQPPTLVVGKSTDRATIKLSLAALTGRRIGSVALEAVRPDGQVYYRIDVDNVMVAKNGSGIRSNGAPTGEVAFTIFDRVLWKVFLFNDTGERIGCVAGGYDFKTNTELEGVCP